MLTRLTVDYGLGPYIATYCILFGIGMGVPYSLIFSIASSWFPQHRATVVGIISSGFGLGALVFTPIQTAIINPNNLSPNGTKFPPSVEEKIPSVFLILGGIVLALEVIACILLHQKPEQDKTSKALQGGDNEMVDRTTGYAKVDVDGDDDKHVCEMGDKTTTDAPRVPRSYTTLEALKSVDFYLLWTIVFFDIIPVVLLTSTFKVYGIRSKFDDQFLSAIATTSAAFNCIGRVFWGFVVDHLSSKCPLMTFLLLWAALFITFPYVAANEAGKYLYAIWVFGL
uniref:Oxalate:formate antiporter n=2 Tax=Mesocestoides corti TaxID=53468 RepID=A0A5K3G0G6_MESCO